MSERRIWRLAVFAGVLLFVAACAQTLPSTLSPEPVAPSSNAEGYPRITVEQLAEMLEDKDFTLVNLHIPYDGEISPTDLLIPYNEMESNLDKLPNKDALIVVYCRSGPMSTTAAKSLVGLGYTNVLEVGGGMRAWKAAGYELIRR